MRIALLIIAVFFTFQSPEPAVGSTAPHDFHYSRLSLDWNDESSTWQAILRVFTDDLEEALSRQQGATEAWRLGDAREHPKAAAGIAAYSAAHWQLKNSIDEILPWYFIGKEVDFDLTFIYLETDSMVFDSTLSIFSDGFFEIFQDQVNEVSVTARAMTRRIWLTTEDPAGPLFSNTDD